MTGFSRIASFNLNTISSLPSSTSPSQGDKPLVRPQDGVDPIVANGLGGLALAAGAYLAGKFAEGFVEGAVPVGDGVQQLGKNVGTLLTSDKGPGPAPGTKQPTDGTSGNPGTGGASGNSGASGNGASGTPESSD